MTSEARKEVERFLNEGQKIKAIQYLHTTYNVSLQDAKLLVDTLASEIAARGQHTFSNASHSTLSAPALDGVLKADVIQLLKAGAKIEAVKHVKNRLDINLKVALVLVEEVARETNPNYVSNSAKGCIKVVVKGLGLLIGLVSIIFLGIGGMLYYLQAQSISNSDLVQGTVSEMQYLNEGGSAPVIVYELSGEKRTYASNSYVTPPDYVPGQAVSLFVNRDDNEEIVINTFEDRYAVFVGFGVIGSVLGLVSIVFLYFARRKF